MENQTMPKQPTSDCFTAAKDAVRDESNNNVIRLIPRFGEEAESKSRSAPPIVDEPTGDDDPGPSAA